MSQYYDKEEEEWDRNNWGYRACVKFKAFGRPYPMGGGPIDWFERRGLPLSEMLKEEGYYRDEQQGSRPWLALGQPKYMFSHHGEEDAGVFG